MESIIYTNKIKKDLNIKLYSDLHYIKGDDLSFFSRSIDKCLISQPDYIFILGDLIDDSKYTIGELKDLLEVLNRLSKISKTIFTLGNHEQHSKYDKEKWIELCNYELIDELRNIGIIVLQNEYFEDKSISVYGTHFRGNYYIEKEPVDEFIQNVSNIKFNDKFNILCEHSPRNTFNSSLISQIDSLNDVDLILAGHYHNGCIPNYLSKYIKGNRGLISPYKELLPENSRGEKWITEKTYGIISPPMRMFPSDSKLGIINDIYPPIEKNILIKSKKI